MNWIVCSLVPMELCRQISLSMKGKETKAETVGQLTSSRGFDIPALT